VNSSLVQLPTRIAGAVDLPFTARLPLILLTTLKPLVRDTWQECRQMIGIALGKLPAFD